MYFCLNHTDYIVKLKSKVFRSLLFVFLLIIFLPVAGFSQSHESWSFEKVIYEVNVRQYTSSGTFEEFATHLDRLRNMGVGILWFMPIHPIGAQNRLGSLGSYYSVRDYYDVNPEFGTLSEFKALVDTIHAKGMYVMLDWVANHTAWDNPLTVSHPEWYIENASGDFVPPPGTNWSDVIQLDHSNQELRDYMIQAMTYWITEFDIDGFRCDAVSFMPSSFLSEMNAALKAVKPEILMLAEADGPQYAYLGFDMNYAWGLHGFGNGILKRIVDRTSTVTELDNYISNELTAYSDNHFRMYFTSTHDENSWHGTVFEQFGDAAEPFAVLTATMNGMPLIYSGQEAGLNKRLLFFDKDLIPWQSHHFADMYSTLFHLKKENRALWNGSSGGEFQRVHTTNDQIIFAFVREKEDDKIFAVFNLSSGFNGATLQDTLYVGTYVDAFSSDTVTFAQDASVILPGWGYRVFEQTSASTGIAENPEAPQEFVLKQNYPNPFNPTTLIQYSLSRKQHVLLRIYNLFGQEIATIVDEQKPVGTYSIEFDASMLSSGIYYYQLKAGTFTETKKMILMR